MGWHSRQSSPQLWWPPPWEPHLESLHTVHPPPSMLSPPTPTRPPCTSTHTPSRTTTASATSTPTRSVTDTTQLEDTRSLFPMAEPRLSPHRHQGWIRC